MSKKSMNRGFSRTGPALGGAALLLSAVATLGAVVDPQATSPAKDSFPWMIGLAIVVGIAMYLLGRASPRQAAADWKASMVDHGNDGLCLIDERGRFLNVNPAMERITGFSVAELLTMCVPELDAEQKPEKLLELFASQKAGDALLFRSQCRHKTRESFPVEVHLRTFLDHGRQRHVAMLRNVTETVAVENELRDSEARYRLLVEHATDGLFLHDEKGRLLDVNRRACAALGYSRDELLKLTVADVDADFGGADARIVWANMNDDEPVKLYGRHRRSDGTLFPVEVHARAFRHHDQRLFLALARDITEREEAARALKESEERFQAFMNQSPVVAWLKDDQFRFRYVNAAFEALFDRLAEEIVGREDHEIYPQEFADETRRNDRTVLETGEMIDTIEQVPGADGKIRHWLVQKFPLTRRDRPAWVGGTAVDVTDRINAESALSLSENRLRTIIESEPECVKLLSKDCILLEMNPAGLEMVEADKPEEAIGQDVTQLVDEADRQAFVDVNRAAFDGKSGRLEFRLTGLKGAKRWMETNVAPLRNADGEVTAALSITREITDRKRSEALLMNLLKGTDGSSGKDFFQVLLTSITDSLDASFAFVGEVLNSDTDKPLTVKTLSSRAHGEFIEDLEYQLAGTPCAAVAGGAFCRYDRGVGEQFPQDANLKKLQVESYLGVPLKSREGKVIGILVVLDTNPMPPNDTADAIFQIFAARAGAELDHILAARHVAKLESELKDAREHES